MHLYVCYMYTVYPLIIQFNILSLGRIFFLYLFLSLTRYVSKRAEILNPVLNWIPIPFTLKVNCKCVYLYASA
jgi:hypothetical protein